MVMVTVPPVGPPVVVPIGRAIFKNTLDINKSINFPENVLRQNDIIEYLNEPRIYLDSRFDVPQDSLYLDINEGMDDERRIFANGTILFKYV